MEVLNESLEELCEDLGGGEWEVEYSGCPLPRSNPISFIDLSTSHEQVYISERRELTPSLEY